MMKANEIALSSPDNARGSDIVGCGSTNVSQPDEEGLCDCSDCGIFFPAADGYFLNDGITDLGWVIFPDYYAEGYPWETGYEKQVSGISVAQDGKDILRAGEVYGTPAGMMLRDAIRHAEIQGVKVPREAYEKLASMRRPERQAHATAPVEAQAVEPDWADAARWTFDRGAIPGEPLAFLDGDSESAVAAMVEIQTPGRASSFEVRGLAGVLIAQAEFPEEAARLAEERVGPGQSMSSDRKVNAREEFVAKMVALHLADRLATPVLTRYSSLYCQVMSQQAGEPDIDYVRRCAAQSFDDANGLLDAQGEARPLVPGDKVFVVSEQRLATVLDVYGDGLNGDHGEVRVDLCGNTAVDELEHYDPAKHAQFDSTFTPIRQECKERYGIAEDVPARDESVDPVITVSIQGGLLTMPDGTTIDLKSIQAACNFGFQETGDECLMQATDSLSTITGYWQGPHGQFLRNDERGEMGHPSERPRC